MTHLQEGDEGLQSLFQVVDTQGQGGHKHATLQGLHGVDGSTHEATKLTQELGVDVANGQSLTPVTVHRHRHRHRTGKPNLAQTAERPLLIPIIMAL